ncbi:MAG: hypothetical protein A3H96_11515 [Acidobacteria bacterium RIFCSPLOWO2_02_FULL_67_36]|nr:MAG: hypothetical protein A3H96_11515 [Acidobacteria bacterium RIFCSPLOWO2_02_FULL_67_36]OGA76279.1 MAG: hypothetical protein A3G27_05700 [Betaproteobacteria bacterium RIFCSPLOWO2_12_FULL_66_14]
MTDIRTGAVRKVVSEAVRASSTVADIWSLFEAMALPKDAGVVQRQECRRAFYGGAAAMLELFTQIGEPGFEEDAGVRRVEAISVVLAQFGEDIQAGRA